MWVSTRLALRVDMHEFLFTWQVWALILLISSPSWMHLIRVFTWLLYLCDKCTCTGQQVLILWYVTAKVLSVFDCTGACQWETWWWKSSSVLTTDVDFICCFFQWLDCTIYWFSFSFFQRHLEVWSVVIFRLGQDLIMMPVCSVYKD